MSEADNSQRAEEEEDEVLGKYVPPKEKPLSDMLMLDINDKSLNDYKRVLVGDAINIVLEPNDPSRLLLKRLVLVPKDHAEIFFDLSGNLEQLKDKVITLKEGSEYRVKLEFRVQRDIISGLRLVQHGYKGPIRIDKSVYMLGSRAPKAELQEYTSDKEVTPSGMISRGKYTMKSTITDDDKNCYAKFEWILEIAKDWK